MDELKLPAICFHCRRRLSPGSLYHRWPQYMLWFVQVVLTSIVIGAYFGL